MKSLVPEVWCGEGVFQIQSPICGVYFSENTPGQGQQDRNWTWLNLWNFSTINRKDKSSHNTIEWFGFILKCFSHYGQGKFSDLHCSNYWKMHLWNFSFILHDLIIRPHVKQTPHKISKNSFFPHVEQTMTLVVENRATWDTF